MPLAVWITFNRLYITSLLNDALSIVSIQDRAVTGLEGPKLIICALSYRFSPKT